GYDLFVQEGASGQSALYFGPSVNVRRITYELIYGHKPAGRPAAHGSDRTQGFLIQFQPNLTTANQVGEVTVRGWDAVHKQKIEYTAKRSEIRTRGVGASGGQASIDRAFSQRQEVVATKPIHSKQEARTLAIETLERIAKDMVKGSGSTVGLPDLRAGSIVFIEGLGSRFSGRYFVTS